MKKSAEILKTMKNTRNSSGNSYIPAGNKNIHRRNNPERNAVQGKINRAAGRAFEERIDLTFAYYKSRGFAVIDKTPEPTKIIRKMDGGQFLGCYTKKGQPDYKGVMKGGRSVIFEAKFTSTDRLHDSAVTETQWEYMNKATDCGAFCWVLGGFKTGNVYRIPWYVWRAMKDKYGRKYVKEDDLEEYKITQTPSGLLMILGNLEQGK